MKKMKNRRILAIILCMMILFNGMPDVRAAEVNDQTTPEVSGEEISEEEEPDASEENRNQEAGTDEEEDGEESKEEEEPEIDEELLAYIKEAQSEFLAIAGQENLMALVYLCDSYQVKGQPDASAETIVSVPSGTTVFLKGAELDADYNLWFQTAVEYNGSSYTGYIDRNYLAYSNEHLIGWEEAYFPQMAMFAASDIYMDVEQFPDSYRSKLMLLKQAHPNWIFVRQNINLDWQTVVKNENCKDRSLISGSMGAAYRGDYYGSGWYYASEAAVKYYLDPRNFLNDTRIFQFEQLTYNPSYHSKDAVQNILNNTFMKGAMPKADMTYADAFFQVGSTLKVSPFHLACRVYQEQGEGKSPLISGTYDAVPAYKGYYNYYNIGASGKTDKEIIESGLAKAVALKWNTPLASIRGGAEILAKNYILRGQDTLYLQKFDVDASDGTLYTHQYMQNIMAPYSESSMVKSAYARTGAIDSPFVFKIPVYNNMPAQACPVPSGTGTATATPTVTPTATPTIRPTTTPTATPTTKPTTTPTVTPTVKPTTTPTVTPTVKPTTTPTATPTVKPTTTPTVTPTIKPTTTPTSKPTAAATPTVTPAAASTSKPTTTPTVKPTIKPTAKPDVMPTATGKPVAAVTATPTSAGASPTAKATPAVTATPKITPAPSATPKITPVPTASASATPKATVTPAATPTASASATPKVTAAPSASASAMPETTAAPTATPTTGAVPTATPKTTATPTTTPAATAVPATTAPAKVPESQSGGSSNTSSQAATSAPQAVSTASPENNVPASESTPASVEENTNSAGVTVAAVTPKPQTIDEDESVLTMDMSKTGMIYAQTLQQIKEQGREVIFQLNEQVSWTIHGDTIETDHFEDMNLKVSFNDSRIPEWKLAVLTENETYMEMSLAHEGAFGFTAVLSLQLENAQPGQYANLFYYNEQTGSFEFMCASLINSKCSADFEFKHASDYVIIISDHTKENLLAEKAEAFAQAEMEKEEALAQAREELPAEEPKKAAGIIVLILLASVALGIGAYLIFRKNER